jgi:hypothetical protein
MLKHKHSTSSQAGQVGVIVLLISAVILVIGLSIANRTIQESQSNLAAEDTARVFSTAESGIQQALGNIFQFESDQNASLPTEFSFEDANLNQVSISSSNDFTGFVPEKTALEIRINDAATGNLTLHWSQNTCEQGAANLLIGHYFENAGVRNVNYYMVGDCASQSDQNFISAASSTVAGYLFQYTLSISTANNQAAFLRVIPLDQGTDLHLDGSSNLLASSQYTILSMAQMPDGSSSKAIEVKRSIPAAPAFMDFALVSGGSLTK